MDHKVALEKVCLVSATLHRRQEQNYGRELLAEELAQGWPGITMEVRNICRDMGIPDATREYLFRERVKESMSYHHLKVIKKMEGKSKCDNIRNMDTRKMQDFMTQFEIQCRCGGHRVTKKFKTNWQILLAKPKLWKNLYFFK